MSDITPVLESSARDLAESGEKTGRAVEQHLGRHIGDGLDDATHGYQEADGAHRQKFDGLNPDRTAGGGPAGAVGRGPGGGSDPFRPAAGAGPRPAGLAPGQDGGTVAGDGRADGSGGQSEDPIDLVTGEMFLPQRDLVLPGVLPLVLERRHGSAYRRGRCFGLTWSSTLDQRIEVDDDGIHYAVPDGRVLHYPVPPGREQVLPVVGPRWPLAWNRHEDLITIEQPELGSTLEFPPGPVPARGRPLAAIADRSGNRVMFAYDLDGVPTDIHHSGGYRVVIGSVATRGGVRISSLKLVDPAGGPHLPVREFRYDPAGRLVESIDPSGLPLLFEYDESDRITRWTDRNGRYYAYHYRLDGRVSHADGSEGYLSCRLDYDLEARTTTLVDAIGHRTVYHWNDRLQTVKVVDPLGNATLTEQDVHGNVLSTIDPLGRTTRIQRNEYGDPVRITRPDQSTIIIAYNALRQPVQVVGPDGGTWTYGYDDRGVLVAATDPMGGTTAYEHDHLGRLTSMSDPSGARSAVQCDKAGLVTALTDPLGSTVRITRDRFGHVASSTDPLGATTSSTWTVDGRPLTRTRPDGTAETWEYDAEGNLLRHVDPAGAATAFEYGPFDVPTARTDPDGARHRFGYDLRLRLTSVTNAHDLTWQYTYDPAGNLVAERDFNGATQSYAVDPAGGLVASTNAAGQRVEYRRDLLGRVTERRADGMLHLFAYDAAGQLSRAECPGAVVEFARDRLGRVLYESINGRLLINTFDRSGRRLSRATPGGIVSQWTYDEAGHPQQLAGTGGALAFHYDAAGQETARTLGAAATLTQTFDALGRMTEQGIWAYDRPPGTGGPIVGLREIGGADAGGAASRPAGESASSRGEDAAVPPGSATAGAAQVEVWRAVQARTFAYRADGTPAEITDHLRGTRRFDLDAAGRVTGLTAVTWTESYAYDRLGNLARATDTGRGPDDPAADTEGEREHTGTLVRRAGRASYDYDRAGRLVRQTRRTLSGQVRTWTYTWDSGDRLVQATVPDGTVWQYGYDPLGRRVAKSRLDASGTVVETTWFTWDGLRVAEEIRTAPDGQAVTLTWDYRPGGFTPAAQTRQTWAAGATQEQIDREFHAVVTDLVGTPMELVTPDGRIAWHTNTSLWGRTVTAPGSTAHCPLRFPGQYHDDETGLHYNLNRYYDPATASYTSPDPLGLVPSPNGHAYVGNPLTWSDPLGLAPYDIHASVAYQDYVTKGAHLHIDNREVRIFPDHEGGVGAAPLTVNNVTASRKDVSTVLTALQEDPALRADTISKFRSAMQSMNAGGYGKMAENHAAQMHFLIKALEKMGQR
ncbi:MAG TPA: DUF6531 domain-containing protein [Actinocrinis sp.]|nr:DUF6531 domain-containing protein [Actinocrinis sp.]